MQENKNNWVNTFLKSYVMNKSTEWKIKKIEDNNVVNQKVIEISSMSLTDLIGLNESFNYILLSGMNKMIRNNYICNCAAKEYNKGNPVIILHKGNINLKSKLVSLFKNNLYFTNIDLQNPIYDPVINLSAQEVAELFAYVQNKNISHFSFVQFLIGVYKYIETKNVKPCLDLFFDCPFSNLNNLLDDKYQKNMISFDDYNMIQKCFMNGYTEVKNIEDYFAKIKIGMSKIVNSYSSAVGGTSIKQCVDENRVLLFDISNIDENQFFDLLLSEISLSVFNKKVSLFLDNIFIPKDSNFENFILTNPSDFKISLSYDDIFNALSDEKKVVRLYQNVDLLFLFSQNSKISCNNWSQLLGQFEKTEYSKSYGNNNKFGDMINYLTGLSDSLSLSTNYRNEQRVRSERIQQLKKDEVIISKNGDENIYIANLII